MKEKVSIIVPVYNVESYLPRCIESLINKTYKYIEIILINDGSTDSSLAICEDYSKKDDRIILINQSNGGLSAARNAGIDCSSGEYICFVDSDDWVELDYVQFCLDLLVDSSSEIAVVGSFDSYDEKDEYNTKGWIDKDNIAYDKSSAMRLLIEDVHIKSHAWDKMFQKDLFKDIRFPVGKNFEDIFIMHELFNRAKTIVVSKQPKYHYYIRSNSIARNYKTKNILDYFDAHFGRLDFLNDFYPDLIKMQHTKLMELLLSYYPKFKRNGAKNAEEYSRQKIEFIDYQSRIIDQYEHGHEPFTEDKYKYMYKVFSVNKFLFSIASPFGNECINRIKHSKYKNIVKLLLHKDTNFVERLNSYRGKKKYVLIGVPEYDNLGDIAIGYSEEHFIANHKSEGVELLVVTELNFWKYFKHLKEVISEEDIICIQGGGNFGNQYPDQEKIRRKIISNFNNTIILMPSTFYLIDEEKNAKKYSKFYNRKNITIFAREIYSYNKMKKYFTCNILLCPDIVLSLPIVDFGHERKGIGVCLRNDVESNLTIATKEDIKKQLLSKFPSLSHFDTCIRTPALYANQESILQNCWKDISKYEVVITDKLHAMIFCYITKTPCVVISNYNYKIKGVFEWIKDLGWIQFVDDTSKILEFVESVVSLEKKTAKTDSLFENLSEIFSEE